MVKRIITTFTLLAAVILALPFLPASVDSQAADNSLQTLYVSGTSDYEAAYEVLDQLNELRADLGLSQLTMDADLLDAAMQRAAECALYFDHQRPNGEDCWSACSKMSAENIAMGQGSPTAVMTSWTNSPGHYANMTNSSMRSVGIGSFCINGRYTWVQCFGRGTSTNASQPANSNDTYTVSASTAYVSPAFLTGNGKTLYVGDTHTPVIGINNEGVLNAPINANSFNWTSSNTAVATVDSNGKITAKGEGTTLITAANKTLSSAKVSMTITVNPEDKDIIIQYDANGGTGSTPTQVKVLGYPVTISSAAPYRAGYNFIGWSTSSTATTPQYLPGDSYNTDESLYLYAVWQKNPTVSANSTVTVKLDFSFMDRWYTFTPAATSSYTFESNSSTDPHIVIYDENLNLVADNDDHGGTWDFLLTTELTAGRKYYIRIYMHSSSTTSFTYTIKQPLYITKQPANAAAANGELASTTVAASGEGLKYTWYVCEAGKTTFTKSSITKSTYGFTMTAEKSGRKVYCVVSDKYGNSVKSNTVTLSMLAITKQPTKASAAAGKVVSTTVTAQGSGLKYTWYICEPGKTAFTKSSITDKTYAYSMTAAKSGRKVYCVVSDKYGNSVKSNTVTLSMLAITKQPSNACAADGKVVSTAVTAQGSGLKYTWYVCSPGKTSYTKSSITNSTYSYAMNSEKSGRKVYCVVTDKYGNSVKSNTVTLSMLAITKQPTKASAAAGKVISTTVTAQGSGLKYTWYVCDPGKTSYTKSSITDSTYTFKMTAEKSGRKVYCVVTDKYGNSVKSNTVTLSMITAAKITKQPTSVFAKSGEIATVSLTAKGDGLKYQWYVCEPGKSTYVKSSITESTYGYKMTAAKDGRNVYCIVTDKYGNTAKSNTVVMSMS